MIRRQNSRGFALLAALLIGTLMVIFTATGVTYVLGNTRGYQGRSEREGAGNAAKAGLAWAIAKFDVADPQLVATQSIPFGRGRYDIAVSENPTRGFVLEASGYTPSGSRRQIAFKTVIEPINELQPYALLAARDITLTNRCFVGSLPSEQKGDILSGREVSLLRRSAVNGVVVAAGTVTTDSQSRAWGGSRSTAPISLPVYSRSQLQAFRDQAIFRSSHQIQTLALPPETPLADHPAPIAAAVAQWGVSPDQIGQLAGYYYSYPQYDPYSKQDNGATLWLTGGIYRLDGVMFVSGKLKAEKNVTIVGEGQIIATEGIDLSKRVSFGGTTLTAHSDLVSIYGDVTIAKRVNLGQLPPQLKGRKDNDDGVNSDDTDDDDDNEADESGDWGDLDDGQTGKDQQDDEIWKDKRTHLPRLMPYLARGFAVFGRWIVPPALAQDKSSYLKHFKHWIGRYAGSIPVGCTIWAQRGDVRLEKRVTLIGNVVAGRDVFLTKRVDVVRNTDDPLHSTGLVTWKATSIQTVK